MKVDNFSIAREWMDFSGDGEFYFLEVLQRKKDFPESEREAVRDHRVLACWLVDSIEKLDRIEEEVKALCQLKNARAYLNVCKKAKKSAALQLMRECVSMIENEEYRGLEGKLASAAGKCSAVKGFKKFLIDVDTRDLETLKEVRRLVEEAGPGAKVTVFPSPSGWHFVTDPFDVQKFNELGGSKLENVEVKHNASTVLYYLGGRE